MTPLPQAFWSWVAWKDKGSQGWLPPDVRRYFNQRKWKRAPLTWQARYKIHRGLIEPAPPHPPAPVPPAASVFSGKGIFTTSQAESANGLNFAWLALQMDPEGDESPEVTMPPGARLMYWQARPSHSIVLAAKEGGIPYIAQAESQPEMELALSLQAEHWTIPKALIGNPTAWTKAQFAEAVRQGWELILEWYWNAMPWQSAPNASGYPHFRNVCFGTYDASSEHPGQGRRVIVPSYREVWHGPFSCWPSETMLDVDRAAFNRP